MSNIAKRRGSSMFAISSLSDDLIHTERIRMYQALPALNSTPRSRNWTARLCGPSICNMEGNVGLMDHYVGCVQRYSGASVHRL